MDSTGMNVNHARRVLPPGKMGVPEFEPRSQQCLLAIKTKPILLAVRFKVNL